MISFVRGVLEEREKRGMYLEFCKEENDVLCTLNVM